MLSNASRVISGENRARAVERLARHAQLVVVHDTQVELPIHLSMLCKIRYPATLLWMAKRLGAVKEQWKPHMGRQVGPSWVPRPPCVDQVRWGTWPRAPKVQDLALSSKKLRSN